MTAYLDHAATSPLRAGALDAMLPHLKDNFGNPSGAHGSARFARKAIDDARDQIAEGLGVDPSEIVFTSGGTGADNLAVVGTGASGNSLVCSAVEHHGVLRVVEALNGSQIAVNKDGVVDLDDLDAKLDESIVLISVMMVNNETGIIQPLHKIKRLMEKKSPNAILHTDAVQATQWVDVFSYGKFADLMTISAHKFGGPQGVGALIVRNGVKLSPLIRGGGQERERRSGTQNVAGIVGMAKASELTLLEREAVVNRVGDLRDHLVDQILSTVPGSFETGDRGQKIASNAHLCFEAIESEALLVLLDEAEVHASAGASCSSGAMEPSHVLLAMGIDDKTANSSLRMTLGYTTTQHDVDLALKAIPEAIYRLREAV